MLTRRALISSVLAAPLLAVPALADTPAVFAEHGLAIRGSDPVAYFRKGRPVAGHSALAVMWRGALWCFETPANRAAFERNPHAFAPRYGGYCALALSRGVFAPSDPAAWAIHQDRLYLNHSARAHAVWTADPAPLIRKADAYWSAVMHR